MIDQFVKFIQHNGFDQLKSQLIKSIKTIIKIADFISHDFFESSGHFLGHRWPAN
jgi:hypothetical protein